MYKHDQKHLVDVRHDVVPIAGSSKHHKPEEDQNGQNAHRAGQKFDRPWRQLLQQHTQHQRYQYQGHNGIEHICCIDLYFGRQLPHPRQKPRPEKKLTGSTKMALSVTMEVSDMDKAVLPFAK